MKNLRLTRSVSGAFSAGTATTSAFGGLYATSTCRTAVATGASLLRHRSFSNSTSTSISSSFPSFHRKTKEKQQQPNDAYAYFRDEDVEDATYPYFNKPRNEGCWNCGSLDHFSKMCPLKGKSPCYDCGELGHLAIECENPIKLKRCYICGEEGHVSTKCPQDTDANGRQMNTRIKETSNMTCFSCGAKGHIAGDCKRGVRCYNCSQFGHLSKDCPEAYNRGCYTCGSTDHFARNCPSKIRK